MRIRLLGVGVKMGIVDRGHAQSDDVIRCPETFADHEYPQYSRKQGHEILVFRENADEGILTTSIFKLIYLIEI